MHSESNVDVTNRIFFLAPWRLACLKFFFFTNYHMFALCKIYWDETVMAAANCRIKTYEGFFFFIGDLFFVLVRFRVSERNGIYETYPMPRPLVSSLPEVPILSLPRASFFADALSAPRKLDSAPLRYSKPEMATLPVNQCRRYSPKCFRNQPRNKWSRNVAFFCTKIPSKLTVNFFPSFIFFEWCFNRLFRSSFLQTNISHLQ